MVNAKSASVGLPDRLVVRSRIGVAKLSVEVKGFIRQVRSFTNVHLEVMRLGLSLPGQWQKAILISVCDFGAVFCEGAVIVAIAKAATVLGAISVKSGAANTETAAFSGFLNGFSSMIGLSTTTIVLACSILISCSLLVGSVLLHYGASVQSRHFARNLHFWWVQGLMNAAGDPRVVASGNLQHDQTELKNAVMQWSIHASKALEVLSRLLQVIFATVSFVVAAFAMNWELMSILLLLTLAFAPVAGLVARRIHSNADDFYNSGATLMGGEASKILVESDRLSIPGRSNKFRVAAFLKSRALAGYFDGFDSVQLASANMALMTGLVRAVLFGVGVSLMTTWVVLDKEPVGRIVAFASLLFIALRYMQNCFAYLATLNVFYPQVTRLLALHKRVFPFYTASGVDDTGAEIQTHSLQTVTLKANTGTAQLPPGSIVEVVGWFKTTKSDLPRWLAAIVKASMHTLSYADVAFCGGRVTDFALIDVGQLDAALKSQGFDGTSDFMKCLKLGNEWQAYFEQLPKGSGAILRASALSKVELPLGTALVLAELRASGATDLFVDAGLVAQLGAESRMALPDILGTRRLYVMRTPDRGCVVSPGHILVVVGAALAAILPPDTDPHVITELCRNDEATKAGYVQLDDTMLFDA